MAYIGQNADGNFTTSVSKDTFSGNGSTTAFTLSEGATTNTVDVFVENIRQEPTTAYTVDGTTLTFTAAPVSGTDNIYVVNRGPIQLSASHPAAQALTAHSATITTDLTVDTDTLYVDSTNNRVGVGETSSLLGKLHVKTADSGGNADSGADELVLENSSDAGMTILSGTTNSGSIRFGDSDDSDNGIIIYNHGASPYMRFFVDAAERMRIDSSGNLLVGTTDTTPYNNSAGSSSDNGLVVSGGRLWVARYSGSPLDLNRTSDDGNIANFRKDGTVVGSIGTASGYPYFAAPANFSVMLVTNDVRPRTNTGTSNNDNTVSLGVSSSRFKDLYLGGSVYLGGTGSANALNDYEEGTFTPTYTGTTNPSVTYDTQRGEYVKIGRQVIARIELKTDVVSGGSGTLFVSGLPFAAVSYDGSRAGSLIVGYSNAFVTENPQTGYINDSQSVVQLMVNQTSDAQGAMSNNLAVGNLGTTGNDNHLMATLIYTV